MREFTVHLRDINMELVRAWSTCFEGLSEVEVSCGDIFDVRADAIVSPANSFGYMDGGIDAVYLDRFGRELQDRLQAAIRADFAGEIPVGQAAIVDTGDPEIPFLISAPTMRIPMSIAGSVNAYLAFRAALLAVQRRNRVAVSPIRSVLCPGLGTAIGRMPAGIAAQQMLLAYRVVVERRGDYHDRGGKVLYNHHAMTTGEPIRFA